VDKDDAELAAWLRLRLTQGVGDSSARKLLSAFGMPSQVLATPVTVMRQVVSAAQADALQHLPEGFEAQWAQTRAWLGASADHHLLTLSDPAYPSELLETADPPIVLFATGALELLRHPQRVAVVGSRNPTPQGEQNSHDFAQALAAAGVCIVSGLALGIDGAAHSGALDAGGATIAVVGTGLDRVYPRRHLALAHRIAECGLVLSEFVLGTPPTAANFPKRNRIIAGLSQGTLVVEAALASGSLITASLAAEMGREVFAIPGSIHTTQSKGCHALIRQGAKLVESAQDVLEDLRCVAVPSAAPAGALLSDARVTGRSANESRLLDAMGLDPVGLDALQARTGWETSRLQACLLELELEGLVSRTHGGLFQRLVRT
jgi:DNA processing protein